MKTKLVVLILTALLLSVGAQAKQPKLYAVVFNSQRVIYSREISFSCGNVIFRSCETGFRYGVPEKLLWKVVELQPDAIAFIASKADALDLFLFGRNDDIEAQGLTVDAPITVTWVNKNSFHENPELADDGGVPCNFYITSGGSGGGSGTWYDPNGRGAGGSGATRNAKGQYASPTGNNPTGTRGSDGSYHRPN